MKKYLQKNEFVMMQKIFCICAKLTAPPSRNHLRYGNAKFVTVSNQQIYHAHAPKQAISKLTGNQNATSIYNLVKHWHFVKHFCLTPVASLQRIHWQVGSYFAQMAQSEVERTRLSLYRIFVNNKKYFYTIFANFQQNALNNLKSGKCLGK